MDPRLEKVLEGVDRATSGMDDAALAWHPPGKWCTGEILDHLARTYSTTEAVLQKLLASGEPRVKPLGMAQRVAQLLVIRIGYLPSGRKAPDFAVPAGLAPRQALDEFRQTLASMDRALEECERRFASRKLANHFILGALNANEWRRFHSVHSRHHLRQIEGLRRMQEVEKAKET